MWCAYLINFQFSLVLAAHIVEGRPQWLKCKIRGGERYIQVWAPDKGRVPFPSIITI